MTTYRTIRYPMVEQVPAARMPREDAVELARHAKATLLHLRQVEELALCAGVDLDGYDSLIGRLVHAARSAVEDLDLWAINNAYAAGGGRDTYDGTERWCQSPGGVLPTATDGGRR